MNGLHEDRNTLLHFHLRQIYSCCNAVLKLHHLGLQTHQSSQAQQGQIWLVFGRVTAKENSGARRNNVSNSRNDMVPFKSWISNFPQGRYQAPCYRIFLHKDLRTWVFKISWFFSYLYYHDNIYYWTLLLR